MNRGCQQKLGELCDFGDCKQFIISPSFVKSPFSPEPLPLLDLPNVEHSSSQPHLLRSQSERVSSSEDRVLRYASVDSGLRRRKSSDQEEDDFLICNSPPPNLTEYRRRVSEEVIEKSDSIEEPKSFRRSMKDRMYD